MMDPQTSDSNAWPVVECEIADVFLGSFDHDCTTTLTVEQQAWSIADCQSKSVATPATVPQVPSTSP